MTEPIKNITFGGVQFNENDIKQKTKQPKDEYGEAMYSVFLKNGVKLEYPEQPKIAYDSNCEINPKVVTSVQGLILKDHRTVITDIQGAVITGSDNVDCIWVKGAAQYNKVDVSADKNFRGDKVILNGRHNEVRLDKSDSAVIKGKEIDGPGTAATDSY